MVDYRLAQICGDGHIRYVAQTSDNLSNDTHCDKCGSQLYQSCPHCNSPVRAIRTETDDGTVTLNRRNHCYRCGEAYPWKPSRFQRLLQGLPANTGPSPESQLLTDTVRDNLEETKHGHEVIKHINDGDGCYRNSLWLPALSSYIHAFEWTAITYLEAAADIDIIEEELNGNLYYFAKGEDSLLDELQQQVQIDQKTVSRIESMNRAERRWMAHHKSGSTLPDEVDAVRARLRTFLQTLFS